VKKLALKTVLVTCVDKLHHLRSN